MAGGQYIATAQTYTNAVTGTQALTLRFVGTDIYTARQDGPYVLTNLTLNDLSYGNIPVFTAQDVYTTAAYDYRRFNVIKLALRKAILECKMPSFAL